MRHLVALLLALAGCAHAPLSADALKGTKSVAFVSRLSEDAGPRSTVFRDDGSYADRLKGLSPVEADVRLTSTLTKGSYNRKKDKDGKEYGEPELAVQTITRFELADSLRVSTLARLPDAPPWDRVVSPVEVARALESFLVQEARAKEPDYQRLSATGADTVLEIVVEDYGMRSENGVAGAFLVGTARLFRIDGGELYHRHFFSDDLKAGLAPLDPFLVRRDVSLFVERMKQIVAGVAQQVAADLTPEGMPVSAPKAAKPAPAEPGASSNSSDDPL